jgi:hypothetical protein
MTIEHVRRELPVKREDDDGPKAFVEDYPAAGGIRFTRQDE